ncbi:hypothetical protein [Roseovarius nanhaiticus]|uniref:hypothetical protein n=1 Tax=Roseovarius nanhaiticus TaxID=573024 RepID=UPI0031EE89FF
MRRLVWMPACALMMLTACEEMDGSGTATALPGMSPAPEPVAALAAPWQNLNAVRLDPTTGCYQYRHAGPVETTLLPLRTSDGRPICTKPAEAPAT